MINIKELRIGNIVYNNLGPRHEPIHNYLLLDSLNYDMRVLDPIPLTEDILLKCGFVQDDGLLNSYDIKLYEGVKLCIDNKDEYSAYLFNSEDEGDCIYLPVNVTYLNQLQNLYFALRGEELNIEL